MAEKKIIFYTPTDEEKERIDEAAGEIIYLIKKYKFNTLQIVHLLIGLKESFEETVGIAKSDSIEITKEKL